jgi:hypothetical protein
MSHPNEPVLLLKGLIARYGIDEVLEMISEICGENALMFVDCQDAANAKRWAVLEGAVGVIVPQARGL